MTSADSLSATNSDPMGEQQLRELLEHQRAQLGELNHRVKNNLQLIISFLQLSKATASSDEARTLLQAAIGRIHDVGGMQDELRRNDEGLVNLGEYLPKLARTLLNTRRSDTATLATETHSVRVPLQLALHLGLVTNEFIVNAIKHGGGGRVSLQVRLLDLDTAEMCVSDPSCLFNDAEPASGASSDSLDLIESLAQQCKATLERENRNGAMVRLVFPVNP